jgi:hypothetical protein
VSRSKAKSIYQLNAADNSDAEAKSSADQQLDEYIQSENGWISESMDQYERCGCVSCIHNP